MGKYYYSDAVYELELNLHKVRRELISMLEVFEESECADCFQIKCKCVERLNAISGTSDGGRSHSSENKPSTDDKKEQNPTVEIITEESTGQSTPEKETAYKNIEAWIETSSNVEVETIKTIKTVKTDTIVKEPIMALLEKKNTQIQSVVSHANAVEAFFKYFKFPRSTTNVTYVSAKLAAACTKTARQNYSYF